MLPRVRAARGLFALALLATLAAGGSAAARPAGAPRAQDVVARWARGDALAGTQVGVSAVCVEDGAVWASLAADRPMYTASVAKLLTTAAALDRLAPDVRWETTVHGAVDDRGVVEGDLILVGRGDPQLMPEDVAALADQVVAQGVKRVLGAIVVDVSRFGGRLLPPGYDLKDTDAAYRPSVSVAGSNYGAVAIGVRPGARIGAPPRVTVSPASGAVVITNEAKTGAGKRSAGLKVAARALDDGRTEVRVSGTIGVRAKRLSVRKRVADPGLATAYLLAAALEARGVSLSGAVRRETRSPCEACAPQLASVVSASLDDTLRDMNTWSNNAIAETVFAHLGVGPAGEPSTWARAQAAVREAALSRGVAPDEVDIVNGSGLYLGTRASPRALTRILRAFGGDDPLGTRFRGTLAVAGETGTLKWRLRREATRGKVRAKTGTLNEVVALAGYVPTRSGCTLAVAVLINGAGSKRTSALRREVDRLILSLAAL